MVITCLCSNESLVRSIQKKTTRYKNVGYNMYVMRPSQFQSRFIAIVSSCITDGCSDLRLNADPDLKLPFVGWCLMSVFGQASRVYMCNYGFNLALAVSDM